MTSPHNIHNAQYVCTFLQVTKRNILVPSGAGGRLARRFSSPKWVSCHLFLFQKTLMLCKTSDNLSEPNNPHLIYEHHIR